MKNPDDAAPSKPIPPIAKVVIGLALAVFLVLQGIVLFGPGGIMDKHGFWEGFSIFGVIMMQDPITQAGLIDLVVLEALLIIVLIHGIPRGKNYALILTIGIVASIVYPGLAALVFLLLYWKRLGQFRA